MECKGEYQWACSGVEYRLPLTIRQVQNIYLIAMAASNKAKQRFFREDLPRIEDDLQSLWELVDSRLVTHIQTAAMRSASTAESIASKHRKIESEADQVVIGQDQAVFTEFNKRRYDEPADLTFEPCVGFFDTVSASERH